MTPAELAADLERRAADAERMQAHAPVAAVLRDVLAELRAMNGTAAAAVTATAAPERLLTAGQVAARFQVSPRWAYDHAAQLGARRLSRRCIRFPEAAVRRYLERPR